MPKTDTILSAKSLRYFLQLVSTMNYTQAAEILGITQPALTQQIKKLEHAIGAPLFGQAGKKLYLTAAGKEMRVAAEKLLGTISAVVDNIQAFTRVDKGNISIGILNSIEGKVLSDFLVDYHKHYPNITLTIEVLNHKDILKCLDNNELDLALMYAKGDPVIQSQCTKENIYKDRLIILTHKDTVEKYQECIPSRFYSRKWVAYPADFYLRRVMQNIFGNRNKLRVPITSSSTQQNVKMAQNSKYDTFISQSYYLQHEDNINSLTPVYLKGDKEFDISLVYRKGKTEIPRVKNMIKEFQKFLDKKDYSSRLVEKSE